MEAIPGDDVVRGEVTAPSATLVEQEVKPLGYHLILQPTVGRRESIHNNTIRGRAFIRLLLLKEHLTTIRLHALKITFSRACLSVSGEGGTAQKLPQEITVDTEAELVSFRFDEELPANVPLELEVDYVTPVYTNREFRGVYECPFLESPSGDEEYVRGLVTHFEPCDSRRAFPCIDSPPIKAPFKMDIICPTDYDVISNMPIESVEQDTAFSLLEEPQRDEKEGEEVNFRPTKTKKRTTFQTTPPISSYLVCFVMGKFDFIEETIRLEYTASGEPTPTDIKLRVYTPIGKAEEGRYTLDMMVQGLTAYCNEFRCGYPLPKLDVIAVGHLDAIAMENWGAMVFLEDYVLVSEETLFSRKQRIARLVFHEVLHQWMGNLVSIQAWKYLWLKEGFARYLEYALVDRFYPQWSYWLHFLTEIYSVAMGYDEALHKTHPVEVEVPRARDIVDIFDSISYGKGASVLRMIAEYMGADVMWNSLRLYIAKYRYGSTVTEDLWKAFDESSHNEVNVGALIDPWIKQAGHPILFVEEKPMRGGENIREFSLKQHSSELMDAAFTGEPKTVAFPVPLIIKGPKGFNLRQIVSTNEAIVSLSIPDDDPWVIFNGLHSGFFRVCYSPSLWKRLAAGIRRREIAVVEVMGLFLDAFALNQLPQSSPIHVSLSIIFDLLAALADIPADDQFATTLPIWAWLIPKLSSWVQIFSGVKDERVRNGFYAFLNRLYANLIKFIGYTEAAEDEAEQVTNIRRNVLPQLVRCGDKETNETLAVLFDGLFPSSHHHPSEEEGDSKEKEEDSKQVMEEQLPIVLPELKPFDAEELGEAIDMILGIPELDLILTCGVRARGLVGYAKVLRLYLAASKSRFLLGKFAATLEKACASALWTTTDEEARRYNITLFANHLNDEGSPLLPPPSDGWSFDTQLRDAVWRHFLIALKAAMIDAAAASPSAEFAPLAQVPTDTKQFRAVITSILKDAAFSEDFCDSFENDTLLLSSQFHTSTLADPYVPKKKPALQKIRRWLADNTEAFVLLAQ